MVNAWVLLAMLVIHWYADFICQSPEGALKKSSEWGALLKHTSAYTLMFFVYAELYRVVISHLGEYHLEKALLFSLITFVAHTATDYITSRESKKQFDKKTPQGYHNGFVIVGFDQMLHYVQLYLTFKYILE